MQVINPDGLSRQIEQILCENQHSDKKNIHFYQFFDMRDDIEERSVCFGCKSNEEPMIMKQILQCYDRHYQDFKQQKGQFYMKERTFLEYIKKVLTQTEQNLLKILQTIQNQINLVNNLAEKIKEELLNIEKIFTIQNIQQLETFAKEHYKIYYSGQTSLEEQFNNICQPQYQEVNDFCDTIIQISNSYIKFINHNFPIIENQIKSKVLQPQINKSVRYKNEDNFSYLKEVLFNENGLKVMIATINAFSFLQFDTKQKKFALCSESNKFNGDLQAICIQKQFEWFVEASQINDQIQVAFWSINLNSSNTVNASLKQKIQIPQLHSVKALTIDQNKPFCYIFSENEFRILSFTTTWQLLRTFNHNNIIKSEFNAECQFLAIQSLQGQNYHLQIYKNLHNHQLLQPNSLKLENIKETEQYDFFFFRMTENNYVIITQKEQITISKISMTENKTILVCKYFVNLGTVIFNQQNLTLSFLTNDSTLLILYKIFKTQHSKNELEIKTLTQISAAIGITKQFYSSNGKFLVVCENLQQKNQLIIYQMSHLPNLNITPNKRELNCLE